MSRTILALLAWSAVVSFGAGGSASDDESRPKPPSEEMVKKMSEAILKHCPDAKIEVTKEEFIAKHGTMQFTVHRHNLDGEIRRETYQEEGPNHKGFMLQVSLNDGEYNGMAAVPQTIRGPYFPTLLVAPTTADGKHHYWVMFAYGRNLDPKLKQVILGVIPKTKSATPVP